MDPILVGALLFALLLVIVGALVWQEAMKRPVGEPPTYVVEDAARFVFPRLGEGAMERLDLDDVLRILEWEVRYLQGTRPDRTGSPRPVRVAGGSDEAVRFISARLDRAGARPVAEEDIREVLSHETAYLADIGAVGSPVEDDAG